MSAPAITMRMLEPALRHLAADPDAKVAVAAAKYLPAGVKLADCCAAIWSWFKEHNAGKRQVSSTRIDSALTREGPAIVIPPAARANIQKAIDRKAREPVASHLAPNTAPSAVADPFDKDNGSSPWAKRPRRPRKTAVDYWRPRMVAIANGDKTGLEGPSGGAWWACKRKWFGTATPAPKMVERFLAWFDAGDQTAKPAQPAAEAATKKPTPAEISGAFKRAAAAGRAAAAAPPPVLPASAVSIEGWTELEITHGHKADYHARYTGAKANPCLTFPASTARRIKPLAAGVRIRIWWNAKARQLKAAIGSPTGLKMRESHGGIQATSRSLPELLGKEAILFTLLSPLPASSAACELVFAELKQGGVE